MLQSSDCDLMKWVCAAQMDLFNLSISQSIGVCSVCCAEYALGIWIGCIGNRLLYFTALNQSSSQRLRKWGRDVGQADSAAHWHTFSRWKNGDLLLFSLSLSPPHRLIRLTTASSFLSVNESFCILRRKSSISLECYLSCMLYEHSGNKFFFFLLLLTRPAAYLSQ